jgi:lysophospholipase L1-like esterase
MVKGERTTWWKGFGRVRNMASEVTRMEIGKVVDSKEVTIVTFGDSVLDSGAYNEYGVNAGQLLARNDEELFPEFEGRDLSAGGRARLLHLAEDGATVGWLERQLEGLYFRGPAIAILTIGGNDLLQGLFFDQDGEGVEGFGRTLERFVRRLEMPVLLGNVYDPSFGSDGESPLKDALGVDDAMIPFLRSRHGAVNAEIARVAEVTGNTLVDLHGHFLTGKADWFERIIEPSLVGASEVRRAFLPRVLEWAERVRARR